MKKISVIVLLGLLLLNNACDPKMTDVMRFRMEGDCLVYGPWEEPIPSKGDSEIQVLREDANSTEGLLDVYDFMWNTQFSYKLDSIFFVTPDQTKENKALNLKEGFSASGWIYGEDIFIEYHCWSIGVEGSIWCEVFGKRIE